MADPAEIQEPAIIRDDHITRPATDDKGRTIIGKVAYSRLTVLEQAHRNRKLICKDRCTSPAATQEEVARAFDRFEAGKRFMELWLISQASIAGSMDFSRVRVAGTGVPFSDTQFDAKTRLRAIESRLGTNDWMICRRVIGEDYAIAETVVAIQPGYKFSTLARFRECLDALVGAMNEGPR